MTSRKSLLPRLTAGLVTAAVLLSAVDTQAAPRRRVVVAKAERAAQKLRPVGSARVAIGVSGVLRQVEAKGRRTESLSLEEDIARRIEELLRGPLRVGTTAIYVADARTGQPVFAVHPDDALNPASNVKLLSTATALELLGPEFRYQTRVLGAVPHRDVIRGDVYLLGSYDPTLGAAAMDSLAAELAAAGVSRIEGDVIVGGSPTRDAVYRALLPIEITATADGEPPTVTLPVGYDFVTVAVSATTVSGKKARRARLTYAEKALPAAAPSPAGALKAASNAALAAGSPTALSAALVAGSPTAPAAASAENAAGARLELTIGGTIAAGRSLTHWLWVRDRSRHAAHLLRAALAAQGVALVGDVRKAELPSYLLERVYAGELPVVLARHQSAPLADLVASINKRSINWLADRVIMTAAALKYGELPSMPRAVDAMYAWLSAQMKVGRREILVDTGSGLSRKTQLSARHIAELLRVAGGYSTGREQEPQHRSWLDSLALSDGGVQDGTLRGRFRGSGFSGRLRGKTGTLATSIALSGVLDADPDHPLVFSIVTNSAAPLPKARVRAGHDRIIALLDQYLSKRPGALARAGGGARAAGARKVERAAPGAVRSLTAGGRSGVGADLGADLGLGGSAGDEPTELQGDATDAADGEPGDAASSAGTP
ncbi:MAG: D-alanyl-D-alanine carboxypeptidase [Myxococcales bacterium]|nr:D-alanyl-D-alanine carboxypeptidase [Myxococcales bacterium]